jgi:hypothetical protein
VKLATRWIRELAADEERRDELVEWGTEAVNKIVRFYDQDADVGDVHFTFLRSPAPSGPTSTAVIGE